MLILLLVTCAFTYTDSGKKTLDPGEYIHYEIEYRKYNISYDVVAQDAKIKVQLLDASDFEDYKDGYKYSYYKVYKCIDEMKCYLDTTNFNGKPNTVLLIRSTDTDVTNTITYSVTYEEIPTDYTWVWIVTPIAFFVLIALIVYCQDACGGSSSSSSREQKYTQITINVPV